MSAHRTLDLGPLRLYRLESVEGEGSTQVASGIDRQGDMVVMLRMGLIVAALEPMAAYELAMALVAEVELVRAQRATGSPH